MLDAENEIREIPTERCGGPANVKIVLKHEIGVDRDRKLSVPAIEADTDTEWECLELRLIVVVRISQRLLSEVEVRLEPSTAARKAVRERLVRR